MQKLPGLVYQVNNSVTSVVFNLRSLCIVITGALPKELINFLGSF